MVQQSVKVQETIDSSITGYYGWIGGFCLRLGGLAGAGRRASAEENGRQ